MATDQLEPDYYDHYGIDDNGALVGALITSYELKDVVLNNDQIAAEITKLDASLNILRQYLKEQDVASDAEIADAASEIEEATAREADS